jgi:Mn-dependent DtxR family transcriptional regulator
MLKDSEESSVSEIAERMNKKPGDVSTYKKRLMQAGVIEETGKSKVTFAIPMFREFLEEQE